MGYLIDYRDTREHDDVMLKMKKAKKAICEAWEALEGKAYHERRYRNMRYRDEEDDRYEY